MITILSIIKNPQESVFLRNIFLKVNIKFISSTAAYASYIKALQYDPDVVIMELPADHKTHLQFLRVIRGNRAIEQKPFIVYGSDLDEDAIKGVYDAGADLVMLRPLDIRVLIEKIGLLVRLVSKKKYGIEEKNQLTVDERQKLTDKKISRLEKLDIMRKHIGKLLAFPATVASILHVSQNEKSGAGELAQVIRSDPAMSAEILKVANSVCFARSGKRIFDIKDAVVRIGFSQTKKIAMSLSVFQISRTKNYATGFDHTEYWFHCIAVAVIAESLARTSQVITQEEGFIGGLLHDLGILLFNEFINDVFLKVLEMTTDNGLRFIDCQDELLGLNHNELMSLMFEEWKFPESICKDIKFVNRSEILRKQYLETNPLAVLITISDIIAKTILIGREADACVEEIPNELLEHLRFPYGFQPAFFEKIYSEMNMFNQILGVEKRTFPQKSTQIRHAPDVKLVCFSFKNELFNPVVEYLKIQGYKVKTARESMELFELDKPQHAMVITGADLDSEADINKFSGIKSLKYSDDDTGDNNGSKKEEDKGTLIDSRVLVFNKGGQMQLREKGSGVVVSRYPVDLRTVDLVLSCLISDCSIENVTNDRGNLKPVKDRTKNITTGQNRFFIAHIKSEIRKKYVDLFKRYDGAIIEEVNEGKKAVNMIKTLTTELSLAVIDLHIPMLSCLEIIKEIKMSPFHKRAKFLVIVSNAEKEMLIPLVKIGVRNFIKEDASSEEISLKIKEIGF